MSSKMVHEKSTIDKDPAVAYEHVNIRRSSQLDDAACLASQRIVEPEQARRVLIKIDKHVIPMMCHKSTLGTAAISGSDAHLHSVHDWLGSIFYFGYLIFEYPQNLALQRFPVGKWMSINILIWAITLCLHVVCSNFVSLLVVRFILGICEGCITPGFMLITAMFYTRDEQNMRAAYWLMMDSSAHIISAFLSFAALHVHSASFRPWKGFMLITGGITLIMAGYFWFFFPDSPTTAWFLTQEERMIAVERIKGNQTAIGNRQFKWEQFTETLQDPKTWLFASFNIPNSISNQRSIIVKSFGFTNFQTALLDSVVGVIGAGSILSGAMLVARYKNSRAYIAMLYFIPHNVGCILVMTLPESNKWGLLLSLWITGIGTTSYVVALTWVIGVTAGHTKRITTNAIMLCAYCTGNIAGPYLWQSKFEPRNIVPWTVITAMGFVCPLILWLIRLFLAKENDRRDAVTERRPFDGEEVYVKEILEDGTQVERKLPKAFLDLTDFQNQDFRYVL
ncbi:MFS general substrate transporter [Hysterangium stoloniferum]|nr:MFS general substrate transporter [Hysterangium stoloniferum]